jgi:hypothetical protein
LKEVKRKDLLKLLDKASRVLGNMTGSLCGVYDSCFKCPFGKRLCVEATEVRMAVVDAFVYEARRKSGKA